MLLQHKTETVSLQFKKIRCVSIDIQAYVCYNMATITYRFLSIFPSDCGTVRSPESHKERKELNDEKRMV